MRDEGVYLKPLERVLRSIFVESAIHGVAGVLLAGGPAGPLVGRGGERRIVAAAAAAVKCTPVNVEGMGDAEVEGGGEGGGEIGGGGDAVDEGLEDGFYGFGVDFGGVREEIVGGGLER